ncbi:MAG: hypothetical protein Q9175_002335 [Cornicularia normoerica]
MSVAYHSGGQKGDTQWIISCDEGLNNEMTKINVLVEAMAGDILLLNARRDQSDSELLVPNDALCNLIRIHYEAKFFCLEWALFILSTTPRLFLLPVQILKDLLAHRSSQYLV